MRVDPIQHPGVGERRELFFIACRRLLGVRSRIARAAAADVNMSAWEPALDKLRDIFLSRGGRIVGIWAVRL